jgi:hypothetical protein
MLNIITDLSKNINAALGKYIPNLVACDLSLADRHETFG